MSNQLRVGVLTISDTASVDAVADTSGPALCRLLEAEPRYVVQTTVIVPDDFKTIQKTVRAWCDDLDLHLVLTTGGTGFGVRDCTPEAVLPLLDRQTPGITHMIFAKSIEITPFAALSRAVSGIRGQTLVLMFPGSPKAVKENFETVSKILPHAIDLVRGDNGKKGHEKMQDGPRPSGQTTTGTTQDGTTTPPTPTPNSPTTTPAAAMTKSGHGPGNRHTCCHRSDMDQQQSGPVSLDLNTPVARRHRKSPYPLFPMDEAVAAVMDRVAPLPAVSKPVNEDLVGYVLNEDVVAVEAVPGYRAAILDGYAVIHTDGPGQYPVTAVSVAAAAAAGGTRLAPGQVARITTGGMLPEGATAVVMVEDTLLIKSSEDGTREEVVEILTKVPAGKAIREIGSDIPAGQAVLKKGHVISAIGGEIGILASIGVTDVLVRQRPVVAFLSTGNEVVNHNNGKPLRTGEIRDSNRPTLIAAAKAAGFDTVDLGIAADSSEDLEAAVRNGFEKYDIVVTTGGVSMGEVDLLKPILEQKLGATIHFGRLLMKPGKPTTFATLPNPKGGQDKLMFGLPGNPVAAAVSFYLFVLPALRKLAGYETYMWPSIQAEVAKEIELDERPEYQRATIAITAQGKFVVQSTDDNQISSRMVSLLGANSLMALPGGTAQRPKVKTGDMVECLLISKLV
ncbi:MoaB/Mog domain-containing protein [Mortierella sp. GBAus27b]|nr:hypothetical protein BGX31_011539 [Mortierella sp. GBA43]KAI8353007.1 MoaB/Mog domain-containing protein [Mortierella sp. GBAus27b]